MFLNYGAKNSVVHENGRLILNYIEEMVFMLGLRFKFMECQYNRSIIIIPSADRIPLLEITM